jgi:hypothetical protein
MLESIAKAFRPLHRSLRCMPVPIIKDTWHSGFWGFMLSFFGWL